MRNFTFGFVFVLMLSVFSNASSETKAFKNPSGDVLLTISSSRPLLQVNDGNELKLDKEQLNKFDFVSTKTITRWTDGISVFKGPLVRDVLQAAGINSGSISAVAFNEYFIEIPFEDFIKYDVIIAMERDGVPLTVRSKGPLWVIYPWSDFQELNKDEYYSRSIWQLVQLKSNE